MDKQCHWPFQWTKDAVVIKLVQEAGTTELRTSGLASAHPVQFVTSYNLPLSLPHLFQVSLLPLRDSASILNINFLKVFFMWTIFKVFIEFVTLLLLFYVWGS